MVVALDRDFYRPGTVQAPPHASIGQFSSFAQRLIVKKGVVVILVLLAVIVLASPAIVGRLAEEKMDENLTWAATESGEVTVTSEYFERGWFSSEGRHRVELGDGQIMAALRARSSQTDPDEFPALIINTHIDHGLIPLGTVDSEQPSLSPGLGNAESTLQIEMPGGETIGLPGTIYSKIGLGGELQSSYSLGPGSREIDTVTIAWDTTEIDVETDPASGEVVFDGSIGSLSITDENDGVSLGGLTFDGHQRPTKYGIAVGEIEFALRDVDMGGTKPGSVREIAATTTTFVDDGKAGGDATFRLALEEIPQYGEITLDMAMTLDGADAQALGNIQRLASSPDVAADPMGMWAALDADVKKLLAAGFDISFDKLEVTMPQGTITSVIDVSISEEDLATFEWTSLLLNTEASVDLSIPADLFETLAQGSAEAAMVVGGGYLLKRDDAYIMKAELKKGLLTVNGAPIPIPLGFN
jgi:uncharacterized protein YdgA (DUF945 family)